MSVSEQRQLSHFFVTGINYRKTDASVRGQFAISQEQYTRLLEQAPEYSINEFFIVSTCNRTEIYGFAENPEQLAALLCSRTSAPQELFKKLSYSKQGAAAIEHLFFVGAGLDSQILGDYEIVGQIKLAVKIAKQHHRIDAFTERLMNCMLQSSKAIKNQTALSDGTVSVSFAAVQYIRDRIKDIRDKKILVVGTGKMGRITCKNLVDYLGSKNITLINRTDEKAALLANELCVQSATLDLLQQKVAESEIVVVATNSEKPVITASQLEATGNKLIIDLSIPHNVDLASRYLTGIQLVNVDDLSKMKDETLARRRAEVPKAKAIIGEHIREFMEWYRMRRHVPVLKALKTKLTEIHTSPLFIPLFDHTRPFVNADDKIQRVINGMASKMKVQGKKGCHYIEAINEFIATGSN